MARRDAVILIVEDDEDQQRILADVLDFEHYRVLQARDGLEGARQAREAHPDLIIMDVRLPHVDGVSLTQILKQDPRTADIPVLAVTLYDRDVSRIESPPWDSLRVKPVPAQELLSEVRRLLRRSVEARERDGGSGAGAGGEGAAQTVDGGDSPSKDA